jgi:hypothetical protein
MLFKTISASVYGIDAYLVEVEVDVGSARMQDFNVVGLPDNAVKEAASASSRHSEIAVLNFLMARASLSTSRPPTYAKKAPALICPWLWD